MDSIYHQCVLFAFFKIGKSCNRSDGDCCIKRMEGRDKFFDISDAARFFQNCYHFSYEREYLDLCIKGNIFENAQRHSIRYVNFIDRREDFTSQ